MAMYLLISGFFYYRHGQARTANYQSACSTAGCNIREGRGKSEEYTFNRYRLI